MCGLHWFHTESPTIVSISQHKVHFKALSEPFSCISADVDQRKLDLDLRSFSFREPEDSRHKLSHSKKLEYTVRLSKAPHLPPQFLTMSTFAV